MNMNNPKSGRGAARGALCWRCKPLGSVVVLLWCAAVSYQIISSLYDAVKSGEAQ